MAKKLRFKIEQIALYPSSKTYAMELLRAIGLKKWVHDTVDAEGVVFQMSAKNQANLSFNYQASGDNPIEPLEVEVLQYTDGKNWMFGLKNTVSHFGMHCTEEELEQWRELFKKYKVDVAQEVVTTNHTNPAIAGKRSYRYVIFATRYLIGVDLKFIVRRDVDVPNANALDV